MHPSIKIANKKHLKYAEPICDMIEDAAKVRGTGIAKREIKYIENKIKEGKAIIALANNNVIGFCYIESWEGQKYVANSGLIVHPDYRKTGLAMSIKSSIFDLSKKKYPNSKLFGITTSMAVMKINSNLNYKPVTFSELTNDETFWKGCESCKNYDILKRTNRAMCLCTAMICDLSTVTENKTAQNKKKSWERFMRFMKNRRIRLQRKIKKSPKLSKALKDEK